MPRTKDETETDQSKPVSYTTDDQSKLASYTEGNREEEDLHVDVNFDVPVGLTRLIFSFKLDFQRNK